MDCGTVRCFTSRDLDQEIVSQRSADTGNLRRCHAVQLNAQFSTRSFQLEDTFSSRRRLRREEFHERGTRKLGIPTVADRVAQTVVLRQLEARPILDILHQYLLDIQLEILPKSPEGRAVRYAVKNWTALTRYDDDGHLEIDNNRTEQSVRGIVSGELLCTSSLSV